MLACWGYRRKMVDYFEGALSPADEQGVRRHLEACASCRRAFSESGEILRLAALKVPPRAGEAFWKDFDASLSRKLDALASQKRGPAARPAFHFNLRPALAMGSLAVVVVALGIRVMPLSQVSQRPVDESELVNEVLLLDELAPSGDNKDMSLDDLLEDIAYFDAISASGA